MKLTMDNGNEYELIEVAYPDFIHYSQYPNNDFINVPRIENITDKGLQPFMYKSIKINNKFYVPEFTNQ